MEKKMKKENENKMRKTAEAHLRSIRISPIKLSAIARSIAGMPANKAVVALDFAIELTELKGRDKLEGYEIMSLVQYDV